MNTVMIHNQTEKKIVELSTVEKVLNKALEMEDLTNVEFNLIIVQDKEIQDINRTYRKIDRVTDVITFALEDEVESKVIHDQRVLGDIYISIDQAKRQSAEFGHSLLRELSFLAVHGFYHLLGYDHMTKEDEEIMFQKQEEVLSNYGIHRS